MKKERLKAITTGLNRYELSQQEQKFVQSVEQYFRQHGRLTDQQEAVLEGIYREKMKWMRSAMVLIKTRQQALKNAVEKLD